MNVSTSRCAGFARWSRHRELREAALTATRVIDCEPFINAARDLPVSADLSATLKQKNALVSAPAINAAKKAICQD